MTRRLPSGHGPRRDDRPHHETQHRRVRSVHGRLRLGVTATSTSDGDAQHDASPAHVRCALWRRVRRSVRRRANSAVATMTAMSSAPAPNIMVPATAPIPSAQRPEDGSGTTRRAGHCADTDHGRRFVLRAHAGPPNKACSVDAASPGAPASRPIPRVNGHTFLPMGDQWVSPRRGEPHRRTRAEPQLPGPTPAVEGGGPNRLD